MCFNSFSSALVMKILFVLVALLLKLAGSTILLPEPEYAALYDLYNATNGGGWVWSTNPSQDGVPWDFTSTANPCTDGWQGVTCIVVSAPPPDTYHISELQLIRTHMKGNLPNSLSSLVELQVLRLSYNKLNGTIPSTLCNMSQLRIVALDENKLTGDIPSCIGDISNLHSLFLARNTLAGHIPTSITSLALLDALDLADNALSGPIPAAITSLDKLNLLRLDHNALTGRIPTHIGDLTEMIYLHLSRNKLSGPIPLSLGNLSNLMILALDYNKLTGPVPQSFSSLTALEALYLNKNYLTGHLLTSIGTMSKLVSLLLTDNKLSGPVPSSIGNLGHLDLLYLDNNALTGTLPVAIGDLHNLTYMSLHQNRFTGSIPQSYGRLPKLQYLLVYENYLFGTIPSTLGALRKLQNLGLQSNLLTGTLPQSLRNLTSLLSLKVQSNRLTGPIEGVISATQRSILSIQLDDNEFTGQLPSAFFDLPSLTLLSVVGSCLHGTLPENICNATSLEALILYGLATGASCRSRGIQSMSRSRHSFGGAFPNCLLELPHLATLLLSSNSLTGSIDGGKVVSDRLLQLDLSHNRLSGSIPDNIQNHTWLLLDVANNKMNGVLRSDLCTVRNITISSPALSNATSLVTVSLPVTDPVLSLSSNRLSGPVPQQVVPLHNNLSVLAGNLFECKYDKTNLPQHDDDISNYQCASNSFDIAIYVWLGLASAAVAIALVLRWSTDSNESLTKAIESLPAPVVERLGAVQRLLNAFAMLGNVAWSCTAFAVVVLLPYYAILSTFQGTHTFQYAYVLSAIYVSGVTPFVCDVLLWATLLIALQCGVSWCLSRQPDPEFVTPSDLPTTRTDRKSVWFTFTLINIVVVLGVNIAFVYVVLYQSSVLQTVAQVLLSLFKLAWSTAAAPLLVRQLDEYFNAQNSGPREPFFALQLLVSLFNNIAIPCLVVAAVDPNCFSNAIIPPSTETVEYLQPACSFAEVGGACELTLYQRATLQFTPPFTYSYECSASFITSYAPTFIYMSLSTVFLSPLLQYVLLRLHERLPAGSTAHHVLTLLLPRTLKPPAAEEAESQPRRQPTVNAVGILVTLLTQLGILLTFGAIFPPVALAMAVSISAVVFMTRYKVQRYVHSVVETQPLPVLDVINAECERVGTSEQMRTAVVIIICYCCAFYAMFLFDTLGDALGFEASVWVLFVVPMMTPVGIFGCLMLYARHSVTVESVRASKDQDQASVELSTSAPQESALADIVNVLHDSAA